MNIIKDLIDAKILSQNEFFDKFRELKKGEWVIDKEVKSTKQENNIKTMKMSKLEIFMQLFKIIEGISIVILLLLIYKK